MLNLSAELSAVKIERDTYFHFTFVTVYLGINNILTG